MSRITDILKHWEDGAITAAEARTQLMHHLTPDEVPELLELTPPDILDRLKEDAFCGLRLRVVWMGATQEAWERASNSYNEGLRVFREAIQGGS
jgi:hypothetical protein